MNQGPRIKTNKSLSAKSYKLGTPKGFTLFEMMITIGIFILVVTFLISLVFITTRLENKEVAETEVSGQVNFIMQTIQRLIRESSSVSVSGDNRTLTLGYPSEPTRNPTVISQNAGAIRIQEAAGPITNLTNSKVYTDTLYFQRIQNPPANDTVQIIMALRFNTGNPFATTTRRIQSSASPLAP